MAWAALTLTAELLASDGDRVAGAMAAARAVLEAARADRSAAEAARLEQGRLLATTLADVPADARARGRRAGH